jgi:hypothetical protein
VYRQRLGTVYSLSLSFVQSSSVTVIRTVPLYVVITESFFNIVILRFEASHIITGSFTEISALSGKIF